MAYKQHISKNNVIFDPCWEIHLFEGCWQDLTVGSVEALAEQVGVQRLAKGHFSRVGAR